MAPDTQTTSPPPDPKLLDAARGGDESAFAKLVDPHRRELQAHCYRMLASPHDAEDAVQETMLRAWKAMPKFGGEQKLRAWLYKIASNVCLDQIAKRPKRIVTPEAVPATDPTTPGGVGGPLIEAAWVEPYPDETLAVEDGYASPEATYEQREAVELAFIAALQHLPANQRAVLITREVLGYSAQEVADLLDTSVQSVNSALQRARKSVDEKLPDSSQQQTLRTLGDDATRKVVEGYMDAMASGDVEAVVEMLAEDAVWSMPPLSAWFGGEGGLESLEGFLRNGPLKGTFSWKHLPARTNGQIAVAAYAQIEDGGPYFPFALDTMALNSEGKIQEVTSFIVRTTDLPPEAFADWPHYPIDPEATQAVFGAAGLPDQLD